MQVTSTFFHVLFFVFCHQSALGSRVDALKSLRMISKLSPGQSPVRRSVPSSGGKLTRDRPLSIAQHSPVIKVDDLQAGLHGRHLAGLTKDQFIDLLSAAASDDSGERSQHEVEANAHASTLEVGNTAHASALDAEAGGELSKTCDIAMRAAEEAKAASQAQNSAGLQASREVKLQLAEKAQRASNAAQAALSEKQNEMHLLEDQMHDAETVMLEEHDSLNQTRMNVETASKTVESAREECRTLEEAIKLSRETVASAESLVVGAQHELNEKIKLMSAAQSKVSELERELERARKQFVNTRESALRAAEAAKEAQMNANQNKNG